MPSVHFFGVRHLSPAAGFHVTRFLQAVSPDLVLIEGPEDMTEKIPYIVSAAARPPLAVMAYTLKPPVDSVLYPLASYSPEYQAMRWAAERNVTARCMDLPSASILALSRAERSALEEEAEELRSRRDVYEELARADGELCHDDWWERNFEAVTDTDRFVEAMLEYGKRLRECDERGAFDAAYNHVREAYMKRCILRALSEGAKRLAVICGAYHTPALAAYETGAMTDGEAASLPRAESALTLMPYAYARLSSRTGYGAGNRAPAYYEMLFNAFTAGTASSHAAHYLTALASKLRAGGGVASSAEVIDAVRLAEGLAALHGGVPVLRDLRDAAASVLGCGSFAPIASAAAAVEIGTDIGSLPEGAGRTAVQEDFYRCLLKLRLDRYRSQVAQEIALDLRENNRVKSEESAFLDLNRSRFLHRLGLIGVSFACPEPGASAAWSEHWTLRWTPEAEIELVESSLFGDTVEGAACYAVTEKLRAAENVAEAARLVDRCVLAGLDGVLKAAASALQGLSVTAGSFTEIADTVFTLSRIRRYGDLRRTDTASLLPLLSQLFCRGALLLIDAANCSADAAPPVLEAVAQMEAVAQNHFEEVDEGAWLRELTRLAERDDRNALLSGYAAAVLADRGVIGAEQLSALVFRRLSPGIPADIGAAWFEGLSRKNRYSLIARQSLWESLDRYIAGLDPEEFKRAVVFLRRAFSGYSPQERTMIAENLARVWGEDAYAAKDALARELTDAEAEELSDALAEYDFGDL